MSLESRLVKVETEKTFSLPSLFFKSGFFSFTPLFFFLLIKIYYNNFKNEEHIFNYLKEGIHFLHTTEISHVSYRNKCGQVEKKMFCKFFKSWEIQMAIVAMSGSRLILKLIICALFQYTGCFKIIPLNINHSIQRPDGENKVL